MPEYLVELYTVTDPDSADLARLGDETCLHLVEADSPERVAEAFERAGLEADRIVEAVDLQRRKR